MLDRSIKSPDYPGAPPPFKSGEIWLCLAPTLMMKSLAVVEHWPGRSSGVHVHVVVLTSGQQGFCLKRLLQTVWPNLVQPLNA